jgi:ethanolamine utilization protein EutP
MKKRVMIIGAVSAGKTSLVHALFQDGQLAKKTQALEFRDWVIDTPGEYSENPLYYRCLMATSLEAGILMMVHDATRDRNYFPPGFSLGFPMPAVGVVTKIDHPEADTDKAIRLLREALPEGKIFLTSSLTGEGVSELLEWLNWVSLEI